MFSFNILTVATKRTAKRWDKIKRLRKTQFKEDAHKYNLGMSKYSFFKAPEYDKCFT